MSRQLEISAAYARLILRAGQVDGATLLDETGLTDGNLAGVDYIDWKALATLFRNLDQSQASPVWAARLGAQLNITAHGPLGFAALSAPTLGDALEVMATLYPARASAISVTTTVHEGRYTLQLQDLTGDLEFHRRVSELILKVVESLLGAILGHPAGPNVVVSMAMTRPAWAEELVGAYDARVVFGADNYAISIPEAWRHLPSPLYDEAVYRANVIKCREVIAAREGQGSAGDLVRNRLRNHFDRIIARERAALPPPTQAEVAASMHLTTRTLIRRLAAEQTSYKDIVETLRREYACKLLADARLTVADVGEIIGYREPANFGRAFRRWFDISPAAWRRR